MNSANAQTRKAPEKRTTVLRRLLNGPECLRVMFGGNAHHAQLTEYAGYKAFGLSGSKTSSWNYGLPDAGFLTQTELVEVTRNVCNAVKIPVLVDADTGHGNALGARRTVQLLIQAGAAGCFIEDQKAPKRCGFVKGKQLISIEEAVGKYRAVCDLRDELDPDFIIMARTDARGAVGGSLEEAIRRGKAAGGRRRDICGSTAVARGNQGPAGGILRYSVSRHRGRHTSAIDGTGKRRSQDVHDFNSFRDRGHSHHVRLSRGLQGTRRSGME